MKLTLEQKCERRRKVNATASKKKEYRIYSLDQLARLAETKQSVYCGFSLGLLPAVVVMNMQAAMVHRALKSGDVWTYNKDLP